VRPAHRVFLADAGDGKRLAGKATEQDVVSRHVVGGKRHDVADERVIRAVVFQVGLLREIVPLAREDARAALRLEAHADAADSGEQVDEAEVGLAVRGTLLAGGARVQQIAQRGFEHRRTRCLALFPAAHGLDVLADVSGDFSLCKAGTRLF